MVIVPTIKAIIKAKQPKVYEQLMAINRVPDLKKYPKKPIPISTRDIKSVMSHDSYRRGRGGIRQVSWDKSCH